ncbi:MAG: hypothetical protein D6778_08280 [Nitrospirae bacterium]|nr:MAG: hypothetical protein D6778_08280 [Nitrospirota bacterium]
MIRINLLPVKKKKKPKPLPGYVVGTVLLTAVVGVGVFFVNTLMADKLQTLKETKTRNEQKLVTLKKQLKQLQNYEKLVQEVEAKKKIIIDLRKNQAKPVKILLYLNDTLPKGVWFKALSIKGDRISIEGIAFSNDDIVKYVNNLKAIGSFNNVYLVETKRQRYKGKDISGEITVYSFKVTMQYQEKEKTQV